MLLVRNPQTLMTWISAICVSEMQAVHGGESNEIGNRQLKNSPTEFRTLPCPDGTAVELGTGQ